MYKMSSQSKSSQSALSQTTFQSKTQSCTLEYVQSLPLDTLFEYALRYLRMVEAKRRLNHAYRQKEHVKESRRKYYYVRHDIYHSTYNPQGRIEKRHKRPKESK